MTPAPQRPRDGRAPMNRPSSGERTPGAATPKQGRTCGARRAHGRGFCQSTAVMRDGRCRLHRGAPPSGPASPHWASGVHSPILNSLPATLAAQCATALATDRLTDLREEAALIDAMIQAEVGAWKPGATGGLAAQTALRRMTEAMAAGDVRTVRRQITTLSDLFAPGASGERAQQRIPELIELKRKLVDSYIRGLKVTSTIYTADEVMGLVAAIGAAAKRVVHDPEKLAQLIEEIHAQLTRRL